MIGIIADDLTGAAELGAVGLRHGLRAEVLVQGQPGGRADVVCVDTDSRACSPDEAGRRAAAAVDVLIAGQAEWIYKKTDSVLRGPVLAELEAILQRLGLKQALLVPANPSLGRVIRDGQYFIRGKPVSETQFKDDPSHPRTSPEVRRMLGPPMVLPIHVSKTCDPLPESGIVVGEAQSKGDLQRWAVRLNPRMLGAGGAEFFGALLEATGHAVQAVAPSKAAQRAALRELFVCGTTTQTARSFLRASQRQGVPVFSMPKELMRGAVLSRGAMETIARQAIAALQTHGRIILNIGLPLVQDRTVSQRFAEHLTQVAAIVLRDAGVGHVYAEGGATAVDLVRRMGWARLTVLRELAPGVATLRVEAAGPLLLTIKPGSYLWPDEVRRHALKTG